MNMGRIAAAAGAIPGGFWVGSMWPDVFESSWTYVFARELLLIVDKRRTRIIAQWACTI